MSADAVEVFNISRKKHADWQPLYESFSVIWRCSGQTGPGPEEDRLLVGPIRFINHSCDPNSMFWPVLKTSAWCIKALKDIQPGEEITVEYSDCYFAPGECACSSCRPSVSSQRGTPSTSAQSSRASTASLDESNGTLRRSKRLAGGDPEEENPRKRRRLDQSARL
ncbi:hypothetical protein M422DRAFT_196177 [Sphaerobolus stellatus SS14]|uniref:SET domain-containing protein n=1 Tax=Sphaerobolus stellatus (strain SS14) TaxID=990650 RepID=A0A0C9UDN2_SPHS4|nr:hypothetical protein M422DRAFT_196177 [Sphaerobolus stellatus SS14]